MAQGINLVNQVGQLAGAVGQFGQQLQKRQQSETKRLLETQRGERDQRKADFALLKQLIDQGGPIIRQTARENPEQVEGVVQSLRAPHKDALERIGIGDKVRIFSRKPRDIATESELVLSEQNIDSIRETIKKELGFIPSSVVPGNIVDITSDARGNIDFKFRTLTPQDSEALQKEIIKLRGKGAKSLTAAQAKDFPEEALIRFPSVTGEKIFQRPPNKVGTETTFKLVIARQGRKGARDILSKIQKGDLTTAGIQLIATGVAKLTPSLQISRSQLLIISEGLGRALSGAAIPETEVPRFRELFSVRPFDTKETVIFKMERVIDIINDAEKIIAFGLSPAEAVRNIMNEAEKDLKDFESGQGGNSFSSLEEANQSGLPTGTRFTVTDSAGNVRQGIIE